MQTTTYNGALLRHGIQYHNPMVVRIRYINQSTLLIYTQSARFTEFKLRPVVSLVCSRPASSY